MRFLLKKLLVILLAVGSFAALAGPQCTISVLENGTTKQGITGQNVNVGKCLEKAAEALNKNSNLINPTVKVHHPKMGEVILRLNDGLIFNTKL